MNTNYESHVKKWTTTEFQIQNVRNSKWIEQCRLEDCFVCVCVTCPLGPPRCLIASMGVGGTLINKLNLGDCDYVSHLYNSCSICDYVRQLPTIMSDGH